MTSSKQHTEHTEQDTGTVILRITVTETVNRVYEVKARRSELPQSEEEQKRHTELIYKENLLGTPLKTTTQSLNVEVKELCSVDELKTFIKEYKAKGKDRFFIERRMSQYTPKDVNLCELIEEEFVKREELYSVAELRDAIKRYKQQGKDKDFIWRILFGCTPAEVNLLELIDKEWN